MAAIESDLSDIQFLGNWSYHLHSSVSSFVSAIVLTPESSPSDIPRTFSRNQTSVVHVGRTPASDSAFPSDDRATFSNPVMSRNHAKITFADSGSAFVIDTNSHHGTWVSRNAAEFKLAAESPVQLHDGDTLTFGKMVQRNGILHMPLTVNVKLLHSASTPSSMSISSTSVSPASKVASPRSRNRFGLDTSSDSDSSSDHEDDSRQAEPPTGPNAICVELHPHQPEEHVLVSGSPNPHTIIDVVQSDSFSPGSKKHLLTTSQSFSPIQLPESPIDRPSSSSDLLLPPGLELQGIGDPADAAHMASSSPNTSKNPIPPWRSLNGSPWSNFSMFDRMPPGHLHQPPRKIGRLLNPLWMRPSMVAGGEESAGRPHSLSRRTNSGNALNALDTSHEGHGSGHYPKHDHPVHGSGSNYITNNLGRHGHGRQGFRLDADWGLYGQHGNEMKEVMSLNERLGELKKDMENFRTKEEGDNQRLDLVFHRLDELSSQLQSKVSEDAGSLQQTAFVESTGLDALKDDITALQNDISILKAHKSAMQTDIRFLRDNHEDIKKDLSSVKNISEQHTNATAALTENARSLRQDAQELRDEFEALRDQSPHIQRDLTTLTDSLLEVHSNIETLLSNMQSTNRSILKIDGEILDLTIANAMTEQDRASRVREQVRSEVMTLIEKGGELSMVTGKRKRGEEESPDAFLDGYTTATSVSRPRKRLRLVADCVAAGALGALGAWFGLAFL